MRTIFLGNDPWSVPSLEALAAAADIEVALVITNPARPAGRGSRLRPTAVADAAHRLVLEVLEVEGLGAGNGPDAIRGVGPDAIVVVAYGELLTSEVLHVPRLGTLNLHFSLLPRWRGAAPVQRAILEGDERTGASVMLLDEGLDTGPVVASLEEAIALDDDSGSLGERLAVRGASLVVDALRSLEDGTAMPMPQADAEATYAAKLAPEERAIDWRDRAVSVVRRVRAFAPAPGATTTFRGLPLKVLHAEVRAHPTDQPGNLEAGDLHIDVDGAPIVRLAQGSVALLEVAPAGRARMPGADWARGARLVPGDRLA